MLYLIKQKVFKYSSSSGYEKIPGPTVKKIVKIFLSKYIKKNCDPDRLRNRGYIAKRAKLFVQFSCFQFFGIMFQRL